MLTLEQVEEGRRLAAAADAGAPDSIVALEEWLFSRCDALLDAAERVALHEADPLAHERDIDNPMAYRR